MEKTPIKVALERQIPEYIRGEYQLFVDFIKAYYEFLDQSQQRNLEDIRSIENTLEEFVTRFKKELSILFPTNTLENERFILQRIREFYQSRGSKESFQFLFRILFNKDSDIFYPSTQILRASDGKWIQEKSVFVKSQAGNLFNLSNKIILIQTANKTIYVYCPRVVYYREDIYEVFIDRSYVQDITLGDSVKSENGTDYGQIIPCPNKYTITSEGSGFEVGQLYYLKTESGDGSLIKITKTDSNGAIKKVQIISFGLDYKSTFYAQLSNKQAVALPYYSPITNFFREFTATAGQTTFNIDYTVGNISVYKNNVLLASSAYTATNGTSIILSSPAALVATIAFSGGGGTGATATATIGNGYVASFNITEKGYGYSKPFYSILDNALGSNPVQAQASGNSPSGLTFSITNKKNEAQLIPLVNSNGEIESIRIIKPGIGYTYATVTVTTSLTENQMSPSSNEYVGFEKASILLNFGIGDIESRQSTVELTAVDGAIHVIKVDYPGFGYTVAPTVTITGDGSGCTAQAFINSTGNLEKIEVTNIGSGYTKATVTLTGAAASPARVRAIISPKGGHGKDAVGELYSKTVVFHGNLSIEKNKGFSSTNDYRQVCIVKNPKMYGKQNNLRLSLASTCFVAIGVSGQANFASIAIDDILTWTNIATNKVYSFRVIEKNASYAAGKSALLLSYLDNNIPSAGSSFSKTGAVFNSTEIILPDVNKFSGDLLTIDNRLKFSPSTQQIVVVTNSITF